jgi:hypothetical protein
MEGRPEASESFKIEDGGWRRRRRGRRLLEEGHEAPLRSIKDRKTLETHVLRIACTVHETICRVSNV